MISRIPLLAIVSAALLASCMTAPPMPVDNYYRLKPEQIPDPNVPLLPMPVRVQRFTADGLLRERALLYSEDSGHRVVKQHSYHFWMDSPTRMLHDYWIARLQSSDRIESAKASAFEYTLHGRVRRMERLLREGGVDVALSVELRLRNDVTGENVMQRRYDVVEPAESARVVDSVKAYEAALQSIHSQFVGDLAATPALAGNFGEGFSD